MRSASGIMYVVDEPVLPVNVDLSFVPKDSLDEGVCLPCEDDVVEKDNL